MLKKIVLLIAVLFCLWDNTLAYQTEVNGLPVYFNGITLENLAEGEKGSAERLTAIIEKLRPLKVSVVIRVVFQGETTPDKYIKPLQALAELNKTPAGKKIYIMGLPFDSQALKTYSMKEKVPLDCPDAKYSKFSYQNRADCYVNELDHLVDIWEVGNEINGSWAEEGDETVKKINYVIMAVKKKNVDKKKPMALTLVHQPRCPANKGCAKKSNGMFKWADNYLFKQSNNFRQEEIGYLLVSYYEDNCDQGLCTADPGSPNAPANIYWGKIFNQLADKFNRIEHFGFGEVGYSDACRTCEVRDNIGEADPSLFFCHNDDKRNENTREPVGSKIDLLNKYYGLKIGDKPQGSSVIGRLKTQKFIGGYFWWNVEEDIVREAFYDALIRQFR